MTTNWAGNHTYQAIGVERPATVQQLQELVRTSERIRALGSRHSFTDLADTEGVLVALDRLPGEVVIDSASETATVSGGLTLGQVADALHRRGWALSTFPSLPHITVAGAIATGTHGSGDRFGSLAAQVHGLEVIGPDGELRSISNGEPDFDGWVVSLGALGIVVRVTLKLVPTYDVRQSVYLGLTWPDLVDNFDAVMAAGLSVSAFTDWTSDAVSQVWVKSAGPHEPLRGAVPAGEAMHMIPGRTAEAVTDQLGADGPWIDRLPHFKMAFTPSSGEELQTEYLVPRARCAEALAEVRRLAPSFARILQVAEIRTVAGDELWLSGAYGGDVVALHFTWMRDWQRVHEILPRLEDALLPLGARPHWGKCFAATSDQVQALYPRFDDFRLLRCRVDPGGKFGNAFVDRVLGT